MNFVNGNMVGNNFKLTKNNNEFRIDFSQLLYELVKLDNYIEKRWHLLFYSSNIIKNNVKTIVLPENTKMFSNQGAQMALIITLLIQCLKVETITVH